GTGVVCEYESVQSAINVPGATAAIRSLPMTAAVMFGDRRVATGAPTYVIAELSANHQGSLDRAVELVGIAAKAGADAVKLQTYPPDSRTIDCDREPFIIGPGTPWSGRRLYELYQEAQTPWEWHRPLFDAAADAGVAMLSTPFDHRAVDFLEDFDPPAHKI